MIRFAVCAVCIVPVLAAAADDNNTVVFKSDVAMTRVDAQVVNAVGKPITGLQVSDFVLRVDGKVQPIRNFDSEKMPVDIVLLLDVSGSMQPHVQRIADASEQALSVLAPGDRVAIMVFDTNSRVRLAFRSDHGEISQELHRVLRSESFNGGTHITRALIDAANYVKRNGRPEARHAVVILTDDETQDGEDEFGVERAFDEANAVLSFLRAPYEPPMGGGRVPTGRRGTWGNGGTWGGGGGWPGGGSPWPGGGGRRLPGGVTVGGPGGDMSHSAGTADIAVSSGGDVMAVDGASAFEDTLARLRQRYALHFYWPDGPANADQRLVTVSLAHSTGAQYPGAEVRYRRAYITQQRGRASGTLAEVSREPDATDPDGTKPRLSDTSADATSRTHQRRVAVSEDSSGSGPSLIPREDSDSGTGNGAQAAPSSDDTPAVQATPQKRGGWPRADGH